MVSVGKEPALPPETAEDVMPFVLWLLFTFLCLSFHKSYYRAQIQLSLSSFCLGFTANEAAYDVFCRFGSCQQLLLISSSFFTWRLQLPSVRRSPVLLALLTLLHFFFSNFSPFSFFSLNLYFLLAYIQSTNSFSSCVQSVTKSTYQVPNFNRHTS